MRQWPGSVLVQVMACRLFGAKPLPEPLQVYYQLDSWEQVPFKKMHLKLSSAKMAAILARGKVGLLSVCWIANNSSHFVQWTNWMECWMSQYLTFNLLHIVAVLNHDICILLIFFRVTTRHPCTYAKRPGDVWVRQWTGQNWFRLWFVACSAPNQYRNHWWRIVNCTSGNK